MMTVIAIGLFAYESATASQLACIDLLANSDGVVAKRLQKRLEERRIFEKKMFKITSRIRKLRVQQNLINPDLIDRLDVLRSQFEPSWIGSLSAKDTKILNEAYQLLRAASEFQQMSNEQISEIADFVIYGRNSRRELYSMTFIDATHALTYAQHKFGLIPIDQNLSARFVEIQNLISANQKLGGEIYELKSLLKTSVFLKDATTLTQLTQRIGELEIYFRNFPITARLDESKLRTALNAMAQVGTMNDFNQKLLAIERATEVLQQAIGGNAELLDLRRVSVDSTIKSLEDLVESLVERKLVGDGNDRQMLQEKKTIQRAIEAWRRFRLKSAPAKTAR
jgi:hypothetical protein